MVMMMMSRTNDELCYALAKWMGARATTKRNDGENFKYVVFVS